MYANTVLIVTGDTEDAKILEATLVTARDGPFITESVHQLSEAITRLKKAGIEIILVDLFLHDSTGIDTFDVLFKLVPHIPIMTICDEAHEALAVEAVQRGAQGFLSKGYFQNSLVPQALRNIIQRKKVEEDLFVEKERARVTLASIGDGVLSTDTACNITYLNIAAERMTGWSCDEALGRPIADVFLLIDSETLQPARNPVEMVIAQRKNMRLHANSMLIRRDGYKSPIEDSVAPIFDRNGDVTGAVVTFHDVSEVKAIAHKMEHLAQHDYLTGLPNRLLFNDRLSQAIIYAKRHKTQLAVLFLDLDNFKHINDSLGHSIGDKLLESVASRLVTHVRDSDTVSRFGGDEFVVLILEDTLAENATITAEKILHSLAEPHYLAGVELHITTSIGISLFPMDGDDAEELLKNADSAMYHAKKKGKSNYQLFNSTMNTLAVERQTTEVELRRAIARNEFLVHYQPKIDLASGMVTGAEALVRWASNKDNGAIVNAVIGMGTSLRQRVVAEGVETSEQLSFLNAHHCAEGQGYLFSEPVPADDFAQIVGRRNFGVIAYP